MRNDLDELVEVLETIRQLVADGCDLYERDWRQRWALERGWIFAGNLAERISRRDGPNDIGTELIAIRNAYAHYTPGTIDSARVWFDAETDIERVLEQVRPHVLAKHQLNGMIQHETTSAGHALSRQLDRHFTRTS